ncbi:Hypothetical protein PHPALM_4673 [Phytophthora palmivora]|uniref:Uncharacterized protein n=1 Tax=Phytophthora palmivora TaxID=4796 RepID=A0A2P4YJA4_9STRA|nr:Hypothetical protein PHPALM_4673 [Phytophthora palmivora]
MSTSPAITVPSSSSVVVSIVPPVSTPSPVAPYGTPVSLPAQLSSAKGPPQVPQVPSSSVARLLACKGRPVASSAISGGLTSPSGRPLRSAAATARQVNTQLLENLGTSDNVVLGLDGGSTGPKSIPPSSVGSLSHPLEFSSDSADDDQAAEASSANTASATTSNAPVSSASSLALSRLAQLFGSDDESNDDDNGSDSADVSAVSTVVSSPLPPPHGKIQSYLAAGQVPPGPPPAPTSGGSSPQVPTSSKKHRKKHKHKHKRKHKHRSLSPSDGSDDSDSARPKKRRKAIPGKSQAQASAVAESGGPESGRAVLSGTSTTGSQGSTSRNSALTSDSAPQPTSVVSSAPASDSTRRSAEVALPAQLQVPLAQLRTRAMQSTSRDSRITPQLSRLRTLPFFHAGAERCWAGILSCQSGRVPLESSGGAKPRVRATLSTLAGVRSFVDVFNPRHPFQQLRRMLPDLPTFFSPSVLAEVRSRLVGHTRPSSLMETLGDLWVRLRGDLPASGSPNSAADLAAHTRFFVAMCERTHWLVEASVLIGLHPAFDPSIPPDELIAVYNVWTQYRIERKRRGDALRGLMAAASDELYSAVTAQSSGGLPTPRVDTELYFDPALWSEEVLAVDHHEPWLAWWLLDPARHPFNTCFRPRNPEFMVFAPHGMDPRVVDESIDDDVDLAEPDPPQIPAGLPPRENWTGIFIFEDLGGTTPRQASDDGLGSPNLRGASPTTSLFGPDSPVTSAGTQLTPTRLFPVQLGRRARLLRY